MGTFAFRGDQLEVGHDAAGGETPRQKRPHVQAAACNASSMRRRRSSNEGKKGSGPQLGDLPFDVSGRRGHLLGWCPLRWGATIGAALVAAGADRLGGFGLDQRLQPTRINSANTAPASADFSESSWASKADGPGSSRGASLRESL